MAVGNIAGINRLFIKPNFANFLESLYHIETLDVTTDAEVLTKMFEKDGLTGSKFDIKGDEK